jgi:hypothetical protein
LPAPALENSPPQRHRNKQPPHSTTTPFHHHQHHHHQQHQQDNIVTHLAAGLGAGFFAVCVGSPVDVVKSRVMGARDAGGDDVCGQTFFGACGWAGGEKNLLARSITGRRSHKSRAARRFRTARDQTTPCSSRAARAFAAAQPRGLCFASEGTYVKPRKPLWPFKTQPAPFPLSNQTNQSKNQHKTGDRSGKYAGVLDCFVKTARNDGLLAFYNGFLPNFARLGSWNIAMFLMLEQVRWLC